MSTKIEYTIKEAAKEMSLTDAYVRALIRQGKLPSELRPITFDSSVSRHVIKAADVKAFLQETVRKTKRTDGRNKYVFYATPEEQQAVDDALRAANLTAVADMIHTANPLKPRAGGKYVKT